MIANTRPEQSRPAASPPDRWSEQPTAMHYQQLLGRLNLVDAGQSPPRLIGITSSRQGEGVTTIAANLAKTAVLQAPDRKVLLVDAHVGHSTLDRHFAAALSPGLADVLLEQHDLKEAIRPSNYEELALLPAGEIAPGLALAPNSARLAEAIDQLRAGFDLVVVDLPPVSHPGLTLPLAGLLDGVLLVVEAERIRWEVALRSKELLTRARARLLGVVINKGREYVPRWAA